MAVPFVKKTEWDLSHVSRDGYVSLFGPDGEKEDVKCPENEIGERIKTMLGENKMVSVTILAAMGQEMCVDAKGTD